MWCDDQKLWWWFLHIKKVTWKYIKDIKIEKKE